MIFPQTLRPACSSICQCVLAVLLPVTTSPLQLLVSSVARSSQVDYRMWLQSSPKRCCGRLRIFEITICSHVLVGALRLSPPLAAGALRVLNDDLVTARNGFGAHPHRDAEIFSYVVDGEVSGPNLLLLLFKQEM